VRGGRNIEERADGAARMITRVFWIALGMLQAAVPLRVHAQADTDSKWLVLPSVVATQGDPKHPARAAARLLAEDLRAHGRRAFSVEQSKTLFEQHGSAPPMTASAADIDELARDAQRALYHVASGLPARAKVDVERALGRARRALESLNRETRAAQHLLDACLYLVRAHLHNGDRVQARRQALECRRLVPDIAPEPTVHPPDVIGVLAEAQAQLRSDEPAALRVESEPMGCAAYVNGRNLGPTPKELSRLSPGEYRIQVECEQGVMGRVHRVVLSTNRVVMKVDTRYDRTIETLFDASLKYASSSEERRYLARDAVETGRIIGAGDVVVAWRRSGPGAASAEVQLDRYRVADGVQLASVRLPVDAEAATLPESLLARARAALEKPESVDLTGHEPRTIAQPALAPRSPRASPDASVEASVEQAPLLASSTSPVDAPVRDEASHSRATVQIAALAAGGAGLAAHVAGWVLYGRLAATQSDYADALNANPDPMTRTTAELNALRDIDGLDTAPPIVLGIGAALSAASVPLWLPDAEGMPWWSWTSGGVGVALAAAGTVLTVSAAGCDVDRYDRCTDPALATGIGPLLLMQSVPLLVVPVVQALRAGGGEQGDESARFSLQLGPAAAAVHVEGSL
jgi:hypothetical protein